MASIRMLVSLLLLPLLLTGCALRGTPPPSGQDMHWHHHETALEIHRLHHELGLEAHERAVGVSEPVIPRPAVPVPPPPPQ